MAEVAKEKYSISELKEELELLITNLRIEEESKGEKLTKEDLPKLNSDEIDVGSTESFPVEIIFNKYKFSVDENFIVTYVGEADGTIVTYTTDPVGYTNKNEVKILIKISNPKGIKTIEYPDGDKLEVTEENETEIAIDYVVNANGTYTFKILDNVGKETIKDVVIEQIDRIEPEDFEINAENTGTGISITADVKDGEKTEDDVCSGIEKKEYYVKKTTDTEYSIYNNGEINDLQFGDYDVYVIAYDKAGNKKQSSKVTVTVKRIIKFSKISAGDTYCLGIDTEGKLWAWGNNGNGQLGDGSQIGGEVAIQVGGQNKFKEIAAGNMHSLAIDVEGKLWAWGNNQYGQLGNDTTIDSYEPIQVGGEIKFDKVACGGRNYSVAIDSEGNLYTWGCSENSSLGNGDVGAGDNVLVPTKITSGIVFEKISVGYLHTLALDNNGYLYAFGWNGWGQLGDGTIEAKKEPTMIVNDTRFIDIAASQNSSFALDEQGVWWSTGFNTYGNLGSETYSDSTKYHTYHINWIKPIQNLYFSKVSSYSNFSLGIDVSGNVWGCGLNNYYQLGINTTENKTSVVQITQNTKFIQIEAGQLFSTALDENGNLWGWGSNDFGQLGSGSTIIKVPTLIEI